MKKTTFISPIDMICPHSCKGCGELGNVLCECCKNDIIVDHINYCPNCKRPITGSKCSYCHLPPTYMVDWRDELIGKLVHELKYHSTRKLGGVMAEMLDMVLPYFDESVHIVPLPTIKRHVRERGIDHTMLIAKKLATKRDWQVDTILGRAKNTVQVGTDQALRLKQAQEAYCLNGAVDKTNIYLLLDDVWTTGASMRAAIKKIRAAGATKIIVAVLAVSRINQIK